MDAQKCRVCLDEGSLESIFMVKGSVMISTKIMSLANVVIYPNDGLPSLICLTCTERLENCIEFIQQCEKSDFNLRSKTDVWATNECSIKDDDDRDVKTLENNYNSYNSECLTKYSPRCNVAHDLSTEKKLNNNTKYIDRNTKNVEIKNENEEHLFENSYNKTTKIETKESQKQQCFTCGKVMSSRFRLKTHLRTHTGERPFSCPHCSKNFSLAQNLKVHLRIHTGEKPLRCTICGESFAHSAGLAVHKRKHTGQTPYQCILCPRSFRTVGHLQYHIRRHTGAKNFECDTCGRAFITRSDLKQHLVTHSGDKPHVCCICGMRLTRASHLKRHIRIIHDNDKLSHLSSEPCLREKDGKKKKPVNSSDSLEKT